MCSPGVYVEGCQPPTVRCIAHCSFATSVTTQNLAFLSYWYRHIDLHWVQALTVPIHPGQELLV
jgi:hypothetical protein